VPFGSRPVATSHAAPWPGRLPSPSPMTVFADARAAQLVDREGAPVVIDDAGLLSTEPARCAVNGGSERRVINWAGPWPLLESWWEAPRHRARLQVLLAPATAILVVFEAGSWWLEAVYD